MRDEDKTREQLIDELAELRRRPAELEAHTNATDRRRTEEELRKHRGHLEDLVQERTEQLQQEATRRRQAEEELREREARYRDIIALSGGVVYEHGARGSYFFMDDGIKRLIGYTPREMTRELFDSLIEERVNYPGRNIPIDDTINLRVHEEKVMTYEADYHVRTADGRKVWLADFSIDIRDSNGEILRSIGILQDITERKQAEKALRESEERFRHAFENANIGMYLVDLDGQLIKVNSQMSEIFGYSQEEFQSMTVNDITHPEDLDISSTFIRRATSGEIEHTQFEKRHIHKQGHTVWGQVSSSLVRDSQGEPLYFISHVQDITERRRAEEALSKRVKELNCLYGISHLVEEQGNSLEEIIQGTIDLIPSSLQYPEITCARIVLNDQEFRTQNFRETHWKQDRDIFVRGERTGFIEVCYLKEKPLEDERHFMKEEMDLLDAITERLGRIIERKQAEEALRKSEERYRTYVENAPNGIFITDANGRYIDANETACLMTGYSREELLSMSIPELASPKPLPEAFEVFNELKRTGKVQTEVILRRKDGTDFCSSLEAVVLSDDNFMAFCLDITDRKRMEEELLKIEKLESIGVLAGGIAHDLNNLLTGVIGNISLARMTENSEYMDKRLAEAEKAAMRIRDLTQQLLTFSKGGAPVLKTASIVDLLEESVTFALSGSNVRYEFSIPDDLWPVDIDEGQINQVINNLVINAQQAMPTGGTIRISAENMAIDAGSGLPLRPGAYIEVSVEDQGVGIPKEHLQRIFDPFFTTKQAGSGLGLATSHSIIQKHNGHITVESQIGAGTTFHIYLPASSETILMEEEREEEKPIAGEGRILVMDDEELVREFVTDTLTGLGYEVSVAIDGPEAMELYKAAMESGNPFDAVIIDLTIPGGMGGRETIRKLLEVDPGVKAIVSSGYSNDPIMADFRKYGFRGVVAKPYRTRELSEVIHRVMTNADGAS